MCGVLMENTIWMQAEFFVWSLLAGAVLGFIYDIFRVSRRFFKTRDIVTIVQDILFFIISAFIIFIVAFKINEGEIRYFEFLAIFTGFVLYRIIAGVNVVNAVVKIIEFLAKALFFLLKLILFPVTFIFKILKKPVKIIVWHTGRGTKRARFLLKTGREKMTRHIKATKSAIVKK